MGTGKGLYCYDFNEEMGTLSPFTSFHCSVGPNPTFLTIRDSFIYIVNEISAHEVLNSEEDARPVVNSGQVITSEQVQYDALSVAVYAWNEQKQTMSLLNRKASGGNSPVHVAMNPSGTLVVVTNYGGSLSVYSILSPTGVLGECVYSVAFPWTSEVQQHTRQESSHPHSSVWISDDTFIVADLGNDVLHSVSVLSKRYTSVPVPSGSGPRHMALHPIQRCLAVCMELNNTIVLYSLDLKDLLDVKSTLSDTHQKEESPCLNLAAEIAWSPCGTFLYASNRGEDTIVCFRHLDQPKPTLLYVEHFSSGGRAPRHFKVLQKWILVANQDDHTVVVFTRNGVTGKCEKISSNACPSPVCIAIMS